VQAYERALVRSLYEYVRVGDAEAALDMCRQSDQSWRAASLSGGLLWSDPELRTVEDGDDIDMDAVDGSEQRAKGNLNRRMWKLTCRKLAAAVSLLNYSLDSPVLIL
jgi:nuclear pore complex protein Nup107